jgi:hypothetical protein
MLIRECLPQVDPYAAALAAGHDFVLIEDGKSEDDEQRTFTDMMKLKLFAEIKNSTFRETHKENEMPIIHLEEEDSCDGQLLLDADKTLRAVIALTSNTETMRTLTSFHTGVEKIEHVLITIGLVTISDTPRLFKFLSIDTHTLPYQGPSLQLASPKTSYCRVSYGCRSQAGVAPSVGSAVAEGSAHHSS